MRILIGGSPSTGSSVFRQVLNRHPLIFCGPETNLFCYPRLYHRWKRARRRILRHGLLGLQRADVRRITGTHVEDPEFGWSRREVRRLLEKKGTFADFADAFFKRPLAQSGKLHWAEKTPANVLAFPFFINTFEDAHVIHMYRNPYDTVSSLVARGMSPFQAASVYLFYTAHGIAGRSLPGYIELRYESFVRDPRDTLESAVLEPMGLSFGQGMLDPGNEAMSTPSKMEGWLSDETQQVSEQSVSRFSQDKEDLQTAIATALWAVRIGERYADRAGIGVRTVEEICEELQYPFIHSADRIDPGQLLSMKSEREMIYSRLSRFRWFAEYIPFPVVIHSDPDS